MSAETHGSKSSFEDESPNTSVKSNPDYYRRRRKMAEYLGTDTMEYLDSTLRVTATGGISEPLAMLGAYGGHALLLDEAEKGVPVTREMMQQIVAEHTDAFLVDAVDTVNNTIDTVGPSVNRLHPAAVASKARKLMAEAFDEHAQEAYGYNTSELFSCYFLTLLSGDSSVYEELRERAIRMFGEMHTQAINKQIRSFIHENPEKLTTVTRVYKDKNAAHSMFGWYNIYHLSELLMGATNEIIADDHIKHYRKVMLAFANKVTFNPVIRQQLIDAETYATAQAEIEPEITLDWEILPPGQLKEFAREIVEMAQSDSEHTRPTIDLSRLQILENIRHQHGADTSYYAKGIRKARRIIREGDTEQPDEYILLILQRIDEEGRLVGEDVVAESPISGPNALYVQRQDVNGWDWKELMAYPKADIRAMGARSMKHEAPAEHDLVEWMTRKVTTLLDSSPDTFLHGEFKGVDAAGRPRLHIPRRVLATMLAQHDLPE